MSGYADEAVAGFERSRAVFESLVAELAAPRCGQVTHSELEERLTERSRELMRQLFQDHLDLRAAREERRTDVAGAGEAARGRVERRHRRALATVFGEVGVERLAYRAAGAANLHPADAQLNLPEGRHSHGLRRLAAIESARGSFEDAAEAIARASGQQVGKRQVEALAQAAAADIEAFYAGQAPEAAGPHVLLVLSFEAPLPVPWVAGMGAEGGRRCWAAETGWPGAAGGVSCLAPVPGGLVRQCQGLCFQPGQDALGTAGVKALRPLRGGLRPAWTPAAAQRRIKAARSKRNERRGNRRLPGARRPRP